MTKHGTAFGMALEAAQNAEVALNGKDLEFFMCVIVDGKNAYAELGGNITPEVIDNLLNIIAEAERKNNTTSLYSYSTDNDIVLAEVESGII